jgi:hypothetical protein
MYINNTLNNPKIDAAIILAQYLQDPEQPLMESILVKSDWKYKTPSNPQLKEMLLSNPSPITILTYRPIYKWSKAISYYKDGTININLYKLPYLTVWELASNLVHERMHHLGFSHGNNFKTKDKVLYSVPYFASEFILNIGKDVK